MRLHTEFVELWQTIDRDPTVHVAVVTGAGRAFSAGGDLEMVENAYHNYDEVLRILTKPAILSTTCSIAASRSSPRSTASLSVPDCDRAAG